jgi:hypothetical protein
MKIEKVLDNLPVILEANTIYFVKKATDVETFITDNLATLAVGFGQAVAEPTIEGPLSVLPNSVNNYSITNFDIQTVYTVTAINGSVQYNIDTDVITYTAPATQGNCGFMINNKICNLICAA